MKVCTCDSVTMGMWHVYTGMEYMCSWSESKQNFEEIFFSVTFYLVFLRRFVYLIFSASSIWFRLVVYRRVFSTKFFEPSASTSEQYQYVIFVPTFHPLRCIFRSSSFRPASQRSTVLLFALSIPLHLVLSYRIDYRSHSRYNEFLPAFLLLLLITPICIVVRTSQEFGLRRDHLSWMTLRVGFGTVYLAAAHLHSSLAFIKTLRMD